MSAIDELLVYKDYAVCYGLKFFKQIINSKHQQNINKSTDVILDIIYTSAVATSNPGLKVFINLDIHHQPGQTQSRTQYKRCGHI